MSKDGIYVLTPLLFILFMKRALTTLLIITLCSLAHATIPPLLPMPQKSAFTGKYVKDDVPVNEKIVSHIDGAIFQDEAYHILISSKGVNIEATTQRGLYWARQTMAQLKTDKKGKRLLPLCEITDWPAFRIRGYMHDIGRSYIPVDELKAEIAMLSRFKINTFHLHLTENQAWRLESKKYPQLNAPANMERSKGKYYTLAEARDLVEFCHQHHVLLIPEIDMPGHSAAFERTFGFGMQTAEGTRIMKDIIAEACDALDVPYLHIGTDEVQFTNPRFVPEMVAFVRSKGKKVISWNPGWNYKKGEIDMTQLWSYRGKAQPGIPAIDCRFHYANPCSIGCRLADATRSSRCATAVRWYARCGCLSTRVALSHCRLSMHGCPYSPTFRHVAAGRFPNGCSCKFPDTDAPYTLSSSKSSVWRMPYCSP